MDIPGYVVQEQLVRTTRTRLFCAWARETGQSVLLRMPAHVPPRGRDVQDFEYEAALYGELRGTPGIPTLIEFVRDGDVPALVFADAAHRPITQARPHDIGQVLTLGVALARTLDALHARDVILGALGPERVLADDAVTEITLVDLSGAWRTVGQTRPVQTIEAVPFMSPEQTGRLNRVVDARSDLYVLGLLLYDLLVGQLPFESRDPLEVIHFHIAKTPQSPSEVRPEVPDALSAVVMRLLAKDPDDRYQSAAGVEHDLRWCADAWARGGSVAAFPLGRADFSRRLLIAQRLYGRECEVDVLTRAFDEASEGRTALLLVSGYSGVGKTSLINELYRPIVRQRGYFASGKIDQVVRDIPYGVVSQAFGALIRQLLTEPKARLSHWRDRITTALGVNGGVLAEVLRDIELVIGPQPAPPPVDAAEAQNRFQYAVQRFVAALADAEHPLVVFLDDLQWVDAATLGVVYTLLTTPDIHHLLIIGAYRDNEVGDDHLLLRTLRALEKTGTAVHRVTLAPLTLRDVRAFVGDTLRGDWPELDPLARLLLAKTDGNPFFVIQFMKMLVQDGLIAPDPDHARWTIRIDAIERAQITDNVIDLMTSKIRRLPARAQRTLTVAACIGNRFEWSTLLLVGRQAPDAIALGLSECVEAGLILRKGESYDSSQGAQPRVTYAFLHDGVQQAAYDRLPESERVAAHLDVGRLMLADCGTTVPDERLFEIVNHLNMGSPLIADGGERVRLAQLNLAAG